MNEKIKDRKGMKGKDYVLIFVFIENALRNNYPSIGLVFPTSLTFVRCASPKIIFLVSSSYLHPSLIMITTIQEVQQTSAKKHQPYLPIRRVRNISFTHR